MSESVKCEIITAMLLQFKFSGMWYWVTGQAVSDIFKKCKAFTFQVKQSQNIGPGDEENDPPEHWELLAHIHSMQKVMNCIEW
jgi:hypothetical protein